MMFVKKTSKIAITLFLFVVPILTIDTQPVSENMVLPQDDQNEYEIIVEGNASYGNKPVTGKACVVMNTKQLKKKKIGKGDIVVASAIHSNWYPELMLASAIIVEKGDETSHAIALGKKLDIPVIVGARDATKKIIDGQTIICDPLTRNVYHIAYPNSNEVHFDSIVMPSKNEDHRTLYEKITNTGRSYSSSSKPTTEYKEDSALLPENKTIQVVQNIQEYKTKRITKNVYRSHLEKFKKFVLGERSQFTWTKKWLGMGAVEAGARTIGRCDDFSVECICVGEPFYDSKDADIDEILSFIGQSEEYLVLIDKAMDECSQKPGDLNWVARVSHKKLVEATPIPVGIKKKDILEHPKEYKKIEDKIDKKERLRIIAACLFPRYWIHEKLPL